MKCFGVIFIVTLLLGGSLVGFCQGFVNLDFESANISGLSGGSIPSADAIPGWTAFYFSNSATGTLAQVSYNALPLSTPTISIVDTNLAPYGGPLQGNYSISLFGANGYTMGISQTGLITNGTQSLLMSVANITGVYGGSFAVMLDGQTIEMVAVQIFSGYTLYEGDISSFAGQTAQLTITTPPVSNPNYPNGWEFDSIGFSSVAVPEPGELALAALGAVLFCFCRWQKLSSAKAPRRREIRPPEAA